MQLSEFAVEIATIWARANAETCDSARFAGDVVKVASEVQRGMNEVDAKAIKPASPAAS